jgi:FAD synthase
VTFTEGRAVVLGTVEAGDRRGRELGFPTANLRLGRVPVRDGVWAGRVVLDHSGATYVAAVSVGRRPTFYRRDGERLLEAYLLDFDSDLYGRSIRVDLHQLLRRQRRFRGVPDLIEQLAVDVASTRAWAQRAGAHG